MRQMYVIRQDLYLPILLPILISVGFFILITASIQSGSAEVSFSCSIYNSADFASESVAGENLNFAGQAVLENELLFLEGGGLTINNRSFYSYELSVKEDLMKSAARTDSGLLAWRGRATAALDRKEASLSSRASVFDGNLTSNYGNSDVAVSESVWAPNSGFQEAAIISPHFLSTTGSGLTDEALAGEDIRGVDQRLLMEGFGRWLQINSTILGNTSLQWMSGADSTQSGYSLKMMVAGISDDPAGMERLEMVGSGSGIPPQKLPPGGLDVKRLFEVNPNSTIDAGFVEEESAAFNRENAINTSLNHWYNLEESSMVNLTGGTDHNWEKVAGMYFKMRMSLEQDNI